MKLQKLLVRLDQDLTALLTAASKRKRKKEEKASSGFLLRSRLSHLEIWTCFYELFFWHFLFGICVQPEEFCALLSLIRQRTHVHTSVLEAFGLPGFLREGGPRLLRARAARPWQLDNLQGAPVSGCPEVSLLHEDCTKIDYSGVRLPELLTYSGLLGSAVDTCSCVSSWNCGTFFLRDPCIWQSPSCLPCPRIFLRAPCIRQSLSVPVRWRSTASGFDCEMTSWALFSWRLTLVAWTSVVNVHVHALWATLDASKSVASEARECARGRGFGAQGRGGHVHRDMAPTIRCPHHNHHNHNSSGRPSLSGLQRLAPWLNAARAPLSGAGSASSARS